MSGTRYNVLPVSILLVIVLTIVAVPAMAAGTVTRSMPTTAAESATVTVTLTPGTTFVTSPGWGVTETLPTGWTFVSTTADGQSVVAGAYQFTEISATPITYTVTAPATPGAYTFSGTFVDGNQSTGTVGGATSVTVRAVAPTITTVVPVSSYLNRTIFFTVNGTNFETGGGMPWANFTLGSGATMFDNGKNITINFVTPTSINGTMVIAPDAPPGTWNLTVSTLYGGPSPVQTNALTVSKFPAPSGITFAPTGTWYWNATVPLTITGKNFEPGQTTVAIVNKSTFAPLNAMTGALTWTTINSTTITGSVVVPFQAPAGIWNVSVTTLDGGTGWLNSGNSGAFIVSQYPAPTIAKITPTSGVKNSNVAFTISGSNFQTGTDQTNVTIYEDATGTELATTIWGFNSTQITGSVTIPDDALSGAYRVNVSTADGGIEANPTTPVTLTVGYLGIPTLGTTPLNQTTGYLNSTIAYSIAGTNFEPGNTVVAFSNQTTGASLNTTVLSFVNSTTIIGNITIPNNAPTGPYRLDVTTTDGGIVNKVGAFTVNAVPAPTITSISPTSAYQNSTVGFTIAGTNFETGSGQTTVAFVNKTTGIPLNSTVGVNTVTATTITGTIVIPFNAQTGTWNVSVTTVDGGTVWKPAAFTVNPVPAPTITTITPASGTKNSTVLFTLTGTNFEPSGTSVSIFDSTSSTVLAINLYSVTSTKVIGSIVIPATVPAGLYTLAVTTVDGGTVTRLQAFTVNYLPLPVITTLTPATGYLNSTVLFTLTGNYFQPSGGTVVMLRMVGTTIPASLTFVNTTTVQGSFAILSTTDTGSYILYVITTGGGFNSKPNAFTVF